MVLQCLWVGDCIGCYSACGCVTAHGVALLVGEESCMHALRTVALHGTYVAVYGT
jgi:hypothetical protein